ncbi:hypothetical protein PG996_004774 [Apiospora saccharicola]|uniref:Uncharacterized protein n=1 Tax=Apiospora saccharicola TaxID=335842 RepID=A0ABR1W8U6_9PEZI
MAEKSTRADIPWAAKHNCCAEHSEDPRPRPWHWVRLPNCYKGLGTVETGDDNHAITVKDIIESPPFQWTRAQCRIGKKEPIGSRVEEEADYIIVHPTKRVKEALERAKAASEKNGLLQSLKAQLFEARELWKDFKVAREGRREIHRHIALQAQPDDQIHPDSKMRYYALFLRSLPTNDKAVVVHWQEVENPWEFQAEAKKKKRLPKRMWRKL